MIPECPGHPEHPGHPECPERPDRPGYPEHSGWVLVLRWRFPPERVTEEEKAGRRKLLVPGPQQERSEGQVKEQVGEQTRPQEQLALDPRRQQTEAVQEQAETLVEGLVEGLLEVREEQEWAGE